MSTSTQSAAFLIRSTLFGALLGSAGLAWAQDESRTPDEDAEVILESQEQALMVSLDLRAGFNAQTDFDSPVGEIQSTTYGAELGLLIPIDDWSRLMLSFGVGITDYDITPVAGAAGTTAATVGTQIGRASCRERGSSPV